MLSCRRCPWATNDDDPGNDKFNQHEALVQQGGGKLPRNHTHGIIGSDGLRHQLRRIDYPAPPSSVNYSAYDGRDVSYPPTAVTTRVEGSMTPSEQAAVEARIAALESEAWHLSRQMVSQLNVYTDN